MTVFYRRTRDEMPTYPDEVEAGLVENVELEELVPKRVKAPERPVVVRVRGFAEVQQCISKHVAVTEGKRCLRCDPEFTAPV